MWKIIALTLLSHNAIAQQYFSSKNKSVYDVDFIVFAYKTALPDSSSYTNRPLTNLENSIEIKPLEDNAKLFINSGTSNNSEMSISLEDSEVQVLANFENDIEHSSLSQYWNKLSSGSTIPLLHKSWRLSASEFQNPNLLLVSDENFNEDSNSHYRIHGGITFSKGRYLHFGNKLNLIRNRSNTTEISRDTHNQTVILELSERKQVRPGEIYYFDNKWFGVIASIRLVNSKEQ